MCVCVCVCVCACVRACVRVCVRAHVHVVWVCVHITQPEVMLKHCQQERDTGYDVVGWLFDAAVTLSHENTCEGSAANHPCQ